MPHQCTTCGETFADGSKEMLAGCPKCDGNKFQFLPGDVADEQPPNDDADKDILEAPDDPETIEDSAQASARRTIVTDDELPKDVSISRAVESVTEVPDPSPDPEEVKAQLNEQFESIRIVQPGQYELNLMELYDRDEYIVALEEDGRYVINVPSSRENEREK